MNYSRADDCISRLRLLRDQFLADYADSGLKVTYYTFIDCNLKNSEQTAASIDKWTIMCKCGYAHNTTAISVAEHAPQVT